MANVYNSIGAVRFREKNLEATQQSWEEGIRLYETLIQDFPDVPDYHGGLGMTHGNLGHILIEAGVKDSTTLNHLETGLAALRIAILANPDQPSYLASARGAAGNLAVLLKHNQQPEEAIRVLRELLLEAQTNPVDAQLAAVYSARMLKEMESDKEPMPWQEEFQQLAASAVEAFRKSPQGETALRTMPRYEPLRIFMETP